MDKIESFLEGDDDAFAVMEKATPWIIEFTRSSRIPKTSQSLFMLVGKMMTIKAAIYDLRDSEGVYAMSILLRSLIEHYLRFNYMYMKAMETKDDSIGEKYQDTLYIKELHDLAKAYKKMSEAVGNVVQQSATWEAVHDINEKSKQTTARSVEEDVKDLTYGQIIKYIDERINKGKVPGLLLNMFPAYSELSSFVHGGRLSDEVMMSIAMKGRIQERMDEITETAYCIFTSSLLFMFLIFYQYDKRFAGPYLDIQNIITKTYLTPPNFPTNDAEKPNP